MNKSTKPGVLVRQQTAKALLAIIVDHRSLDEAITIHSPDLDSVDRPLMQALCYGVMRWYLPLMALLEMLSDKPVKKMAQPVQVLVLLGLYQLRETRIPPHAAIHATVDCAPRLKSSRAKGLINALLRNYQRQHEQLQARLEKQPTAKYAHPVWMMKRLQKDWPDQWEVIVKANNCQAPMTLRLDITQTDRDKYIEDLANESMIATPHPLAPGAINLSRATGVEALPGFKEGLVSVQDAAAQLAAPLLLHNATHRVLDACAAPGGKTAHILQLCEPARLDALDISGDRLEKLGSMFDRIGKQANIIEGDAASPETWWDKKAYDRILLDAPCSAGGVIRRHPDIKYHRNEGSLDKIVERQSRLLDALWSLLLPGGILVYVTCSVFKAENEDQIRAFLGRHDDVTSDAIPGDWGHGEIGRQILPGEMDMDGFYFARLIKGPPSN